MTTFGGGRLHHELDDVAACHHSTIRDIMPDMSGSKPLVKPFGAVDTLGGVLLLLLILGIPVLFVVCVRMAVMSDDAVPVSTRESSPLPWMP